MKELLLPYKDLTSLDGIDLTNVTYFDCSGNFLTSLPTLPDCLQRLICCNNLLTSLPALPDSLLQLGCGDNKLTSLPSLPIGLLSLSCSHNKLTFLPTLPHGIIEIYCRENILSSLPSLPDSLVQLSCSNNKLTFLPILPIGLRYLSREGNSLPKKGHAKIKLQQHNQMRQDMGLPIVGKMENGQEIKDQWTIWQYRLDGEKYNTAKSVMNFCE